MDFLKDKLIVLCGTLVLLAVIGALTALVLTNHDTSAFRFVSLIGSGLLQIAGLFGLILRQRSIGQKVEKTQKAAELTHDQVTNGALTDQFSEYLDTMIRARIDIARELHDAGLEEDDDKG